MAEKTTLRIEIEYSHKNIHYADISISEEVTPELLNVLRVIEGVENADSNRRYSLYFSSGKCFDSKEVAKAIETAIRDHFKK